MPTVLPQRYLNTEWRPPNRREEEAVLALAPPEVVIAALGLTLADERRQRLDTVAASRLAGVVVVLEDLHNPHNGGAVLRSCEAVGIHEVQFIEGREEFRTSSKITQGCDKWLDVIRQTDTDACLSALRRRGFRLCAAVPGAATRLEDLDPLLPTAFLLGNEHTGLSAAARAQCDSEFAIPLAGFSESLNLSVATAITVYTHCTRRRAAVGQRGDLDPQALLELRARYYARDVRGGPALIEHYLRRRSTPATSLPGL